MKDALMLLGLFAFGVALGWWLKGRTPTTRKRALQVGLLILAAPIPVWLFASMAGNETYGLLAGFALMGMVAVAVPLALSVFVGWKLAGRIRSRQ